MTKVTLTASMRSNLLSLQQTQKLQDSTQLRLSTGLKINSAIDNPSSYYTATSLNNRAADLSALLDTMSQGIQTIKAANEGIETGLSLLAQLKSISEQAILGADKDLENEAVSKILVSLGYTAITKDMAIDEINTLLATSGAKLVLADDLTLTDGLKITGNNVTLNGAGHTLRFSGDNGSAIKVTGTNAQANINNIKIEASGENVIGLKVSNGAKAVLDTKENIEVSGVNAQKIWYRDEALYDGKGNTQAIINQIGAAGLAATAANEFYAPGVNADDANFGQGTWYLPAIGELMDMYGTDTSQMTSGSGTSGATGENKALINDSLSTLKEKRVDAEVLTGTYYWSSSEFDSGNSYEFYMINGTRTNYYKHNTHRVRIFQLVENCFYSEAASGGEGSGVPAPKIGDVMYSDCSYGSAKDCDASSDKKVMGVVTWVSEDGQSAKIMNLKDLTFDAEGNFNPDEPYKGDYSYSQWATSGTASSTDITDIPNYNYMALLKAMKASGPISVTNNHDANIFIDAEAYQKQFNSALSQYNGLVRDTSYKGINLLNGDELVLTFNEDRTHHFIVQGRDISSSSIGLEEVIWNTIESIEETLGDIQNAISILRSLSTELGSNYQIVQTRQDFTEALIDVLETGADKLTLADMNAESANMLALQTRQQLAINSLSLASQAAQSVLRLF